ncbi:asparagine synthase-related protein [Sinosporangium siamense]|uniref:asparagine synthase (glutamine-hydrolyzing) n=1 Tax=Sinosporangium siamense TaxID=1367973 RepID=A0A919V7D9_9ACTN|nr:asparagine synthase-related protein [Sinosporangium siamense]GII95025.1 hypothetical protein Ssi02_52560 [Sinosporangium siamense]
MRVHRDPGFVVLPDNEPGRQVAARLLSWGAVLATHRSGRPWIVGRCWDRPVTRVPLPHGELVLLGHHSGTADSLAQAAGKMRHVSEVDGLVRGLDGSFHLVARLGDTVRVQGSALGCTRLYYTTGENPEMVSDRAYLLGRLTDASVDPRALAGHLVEPVAHWIGERPLLRGVTPVPLGHYLATPAHGGTPRRVRWWRPPQPHLGLADGAALLRERLTAAVGTRTAGGGLVSSELSGGYDSTSLGFLAARGEARLIVHTVPIRETTSEDLSWATIAAGEMAGVEHDIMPADDMPLVYAGVSEVHDRLDEPSTAIASRARVVAMVRRFAERGSRVHLTGHGGDHLFIGVPTHFHGQLAVRPVEAFRRLRAFAALFGWSNTALARAMADRRDYRRWCAGHINPAVGPLDIRTPLLGWMIPPTVPPWVTREGRRLLGGLLREMGRDSSPLSPDRGMHAELESLSDGVRLVRAMNHMVVNTGVPAAMPYFDDRVVEAVLRVRPEARVTPWTYKPLLGAAMRGIVPDRVLSRSSKDRGSLDLARGLRVHRDELASLWENSRLGELGLVDARMLRDLAVNPSTPGLDGGSLDSTIGCEVWLRGLEAAELQPAESAARRM